MSSLISHRVLLASLILVAVPLAAQTLPLEKRVFILSKTYASIPIEFAHWRTASFAPDRLDSVYWSFLKRTIATESRREFALIMREFIALLNNTHSWYIDNNVAESTLPMGFTTVYLDNRWIVRRSVVDGLTPGDILLNMNGKTVDDVYKEQGKYISATTDLSKHELLISSVALSLPDEYRLEVENRKGDARQFSIRRLSLPKLPEPDSSVSRWIARDKIGYIMIPSFMERRFEQAALDQLKAFQHVPVLIIDVRGNRGGSTPEQLTRALMNKPYRWWTEGTPLTLGLFRYYAEAWPSNSINDYFRQAQLVWQSDVTKPDSNAYQGQIILLVDRYTGSAAEDFTVPFKDNGRALIVGESTNGSSGQPYMFSFGDGINIGIGTKREYMPNGSEFEGVGIQPDIKVSYEREDLYTGRDRALEMAVTEGNRLLRDR